MSYSEEEIQKYLHILESFKGIFYDITEINEDYFTNSLKKKYLVIIVTILILSKMMVLVIVINVFIQLVIFLVIMK